MVTGVRGVTLFVPSVAQVRDFYAETLALELTAEEDEMITFDVGGQMLCLDARGGRKGRGAGHVLWFRCADFASTSERLKAAGVEFVRGPERSTGNGKWFVLVRDPAGNEVRVDEE